MRKLVVSLCVVVMMMLVPGCGEPPSDEGDPIELSQSRVYALDNGTTWAYSIVLPVYEVNMDEPPKWEDLRVHVVTVNTSLLYPRTEVLLDQPLKRQPTVGASAIYYFAYEGDETEQVSNKGYIAIHGMNLSFQSAQFSLNLEGETLTSFILPDDFRTPPFYITFSEIRMTPIQSVGVERWEASWTIMDIEPHGANIPFANLSYIVDAYNTEFFVEQRHVVQDPAFGGPYDRNSHGDNVRGWYVSMTNGTVMRVGDTIRLTSISENYTEARIELTINNTVVKMTHLPEVFP